MLFVVSQFFLFLALESVHALEHLVPVNQGTIELWTVNADKLCLAANGQSAGTTHACTVDHDGIQRYFTGNAVLLGGQVGELHHDGRANGKHLVHMGLLLDKLLYTNSDNAFLTIRSVVCHDDDFIGRLANLVF